MPAVMILAPMVFAAVVRSPTATESIKINPEQLCGLFQPSSRDTSLPDDTAMLPAPVPAAVFVTPRAPADSGQVNAYVCMVASTRRRANVSVSIKLFDTNGRWWGEDGSPELCQPTVQVTQGKMNETCSRSHWLAARAIAKFPFEKLPVPPESERIEPTTSQRGPYAVVSVGWSNCSETDSKVPVCDGEVKRQYYTLPTLQLPTELPLAK